MNARYRLDPSHSRFTVQAYAGGLLSFAAHSPTFVVQDFHGELQFDPANPADGSLEVVVPADSLQLVDEVRAAERHEIESRMRSEVLETSRYPEIRLEAKELAATLLGDHRYRLRINGRLALHGVINPLALDAELVIYSDGVRAAGAFALRLSNYRIRPVTALGGAIKLKDELRLEFEIVAWKV